MEIDRRFAREDVEIPYAKLDLHIKEAGRQNPE